MVGGKAAAGTAELRDAFSIRAAGVCATATAVCLASAEVEGEPEVVGDVSEETGRSPGE